MRYILIALCIPAALIVATSAVEAQDLPSSLTALAFYSPSPSVTRATGSPFISSDTSTKKHRSQDRVRSFVFSAAAGQTWSRRASKVIEAEHIFFIYEPHNKFEAGFTFCIDCKSSSSKRPHIGFSYSYFEAVVEAWTRAFEIGKLTSHTVAISPFSTHISSNNGWILQYFDLGTLSLSFGELNSDEPWFYTPELNGVTYETSLTGEIKPSIGFSALHYGLYIRLLPGTYLGLRTILVYQSVKRWEIEVVDPPGGPFTERIHAIDNWLPVFLELKIAP